MFLNLSVIFIQTSNDKKLLHPANVDLEYADFLPQRGNPSSKKVVSLVWL